MSNGKVLWDVNVLVEVRFPNTACFLFQTKAFFNHKLTDNTNNKNNDMDDNGIPQSFYCPLTQEIMQDPVQAADGYRY
jgi:hypothetical protein